MISVIMLSYNNVRFLMESIQSVLNQTYTDWELVISDDGSTDGSWEIAQAMEKKHKKIKAFQTSERLGIPKNRKFAFEKIKGEFFCHLDGDDALFPYTLSTLIDNIKNFDMVFSDMVWIDENGKNIQYYQNESVEIKDLGYRHITLFRKSVYDKLQGYNDQLKHYCEDGDLFMQFAEKKNYKLIPQVLYKFRQHGNNTSRLKKDCRTCLDKPHCNYIKIWAKENDWDVDQWKWRKSENYVPVIGVQ